MQQNQIDSIVEAVKTLVKAMPNVPEGTQHQDSSGPSKENDPPLLYPQGQGNNDGTLPSIDTTVSYSNDDAVSVQASNIFFDKKSKPNDDKEDTCDDTSNRAEEQTVEGGQL